MVICNNSDYTVVWDLDGEWTPYGTKTMRVNLADGTYQDVVFTGDNAPLPVLTASGWVSVGLYAGDLHTSRAARLLALSSVLTPVGSPAAPAEDVYAQIMAKLNELSTVSPEDIAKAVEDYLAEHPIEETDPTVPEWAKADITGAAVGQIAKIAAVDASCVPTAWEPVDMPSGGGSNWEKVYDGSNTIAEEISVFEVDLAKNDPMKEFQLWLKLDQNMAADWGAVKNISVTVNGETIGYFFFSHRLNTYVEFYEERSLEAMTVAKRCMNVVNLSYNGTSPMWMVEQGVRRQNNGKLSIHFPAPYAGKITAKVYGRY